MKHNHITATATTNDYNYCIMRYVVRPCIISHHHTSTNRSTHHLRVHTSSKALVSWGYPADINHSASSSPSEMINERVCYYMIFLLSRPVPFQFMMRYLIWQDNIPNTHADRHTAHIDFKWMITERPNYRIARGSVSEWASNRWKFRLRVCILGTPNQTQRKRVINGYFLSLYLDRIDTIN